MLLKRILYIGQFQPGTTSYSRGCFLKENVPQAEFNSIDTLKPFYETPKVFRSLGFRWKMGPLIRRMNTFVIDQIKGGKYDLIWVDKAVFLTESTTKKLRDKARFLIHFTPDPAFTYHYSRHFEKSLKHYDRVVTTKSYEIDQYASFMDKRQLMLVTQSYDPTLHYPRKKFEERIPGVCFIGHHENERQEIVEALLQNDLPVFIAGRGWKRVANKYSRNDRLIFGGQGIYGDEYAEKISEYRFGLGLLSKWVPEKHTTRCFEIPACGSILATERNDETCAFFEEDEALFFEDPSELIRKLQQLRKNSQQAKNIAEKGTRRVKEGDFDCGSIVSKVLISLDHNFTSSLD